MSVQVVHTSESMSKQADIAGGFRAGDRGPQQGDTAPLPGIRRYESLYGA